MPKAANATAGAHCSAALRCHRRTAVCERLHSDRRGSCRYDWERLPVSSLAIGRHGWWQRMNFVVAGGLYSCAGAGLRRAANRRPGPGGCTTFSPSRSSPASPSPPWPARPPPYGAGTSAGLATRPRQASPWSGVPLCSASAFGDEPRLSGKGGVFQRLSIACGCGWLTALSLRALSYPAH